MKKIEIFLMKAKKIVLHQKKKSKASPKTTELSNLILFFANFVDNFCSGLFNFWDFYLFLKLILKALDDWNFNCGAQYK